MPVLYSPIDHEPWLETLTPQFRSGYLIIDDDYAERSDDAKIVGQLRTVCTHSGYTLRETSGGRRTGNRLRNNLALMRGCGFAIAVYSEGMPVHAVADICYEVAICAAVGRPVLHVRSGNIREPSNLASSEKIRFNHEQPEAFAAKVASALSEFEADAAYLSDRGDIAFDASDRDIQAALEYHTLQWLLTGSLSAEAGIEKIIKATNASDIPALKRDLYSSVGTEARELIRKMKSARERFDANPDRFSGQASSE